MTVTGGRLATTSASTTEYPESKEAAVANRWNRRDVLKTGMAAGVGTLGVPASAPAVITRQAKRPIAITSANGLAAAAKAIEMVSGGADTLDAVIAGVNIVELDPNDNERRLRRASQRRGCCAAGCLGNAWALEPCRGGGRDRRCEDTVQRGAAGGLPDRSRPACRRGGLHDLPRRMGTVQRIC